MKTYLQKGFTLIELLVVIAIIGILSSIVLASLNTARSKGGDAAVKGNLSGIRAQAAIYQDTYGHYGAENRTALDCSAAGVGLFADTNVRSAVAAAEGAGSGNSVCISSNNTATAGGNAESWAIAVGLKTEPTLRFCVDSSGRSTTTTGTAALVSNVASCP